MTWWQILLIVIVGGLLNIVISGIGMYLMLKLVMTIFLNNENYAKWITVSNKMKQILRIKNIRIDEKVDDGPNGGY